MGQVQEDSEIIKTKPQPLPLPSENPTGLHSRYIVTKREGETDPNAQYFVLRLDKGGTDEAHVKACRVAILGYAAAIAHHLPELAADIRRRYDAKL